MWASGPYYSHYYQYINATVSISKLKLLHFASIQQCLITQDYIEWFLYNYIHLLIQLLGLYFTANSLPRVPYSVVAVAAQLSTTNQATESHHKIFLAKPYLYGSCKEPTKYFLVQMPILILKFHPHENQGFSRDVLCIKWKSVHLREQSAPPIFDNRR